jgi:hypothetical protein
MENEQVIDEMGFLKVIPHTENSDAVYIACYECVTHNLAEMQNRNIGTVIEVVRTVKALGKQTEKENEEEHSTNESEREDELRWLRNNVHFGRWIEVERGQINQELVET